MLVPVLLVIGMTAVELLNTDPVVGELKVKVQEPPGEMIRQLLASWVTLDQLLGKVAETLLALLAEVFRTVIVLLAPSESNDKFEAVRVAMGLAPPPILAGRIGGKIAIGGKMGLLGGKGKAILVAVPMPVLKPVGAMLIGRGLKARISLEKSAAPEAMFTKLP